MKDLQSHVWKKLSFRKYVAGRECVERLVRRVVRRWQMAGISFSGQAEEVEWVERTSGHRVGFFREMILSSLVVEVVSIVWGWWRVSRSHRVKMDVYASEMMWR